MISIPFTIIFKIPNVSRVTKNGFKELKSYNRYLKRKEGNDYKQVYLFKEGKRYKRYVHRLVYENFVSDIPHNLQINHKDLNKFNNDINNLELVTQKENIQHYWSNK